MEKNDPALPSASPDSLTATKNNSEGGGKADLYEQLFSKRWNFGENLINHSMELKLLRYTNEDEDYVRAAETIAAQPICISPWEAPAGNSRRDEYQSREMRNRNDQQQHRGGGRGGWGRGQGHWHSNNNPDRGRGERRNWNREHWNSHRSYQDNRW